MTKKVKMKTTKAWAVVKGGGIVNTYRLEMAVFRKKYEAVWEVELSPEDERISLRIVPVEIRELQSQKKNR